MTYEKQIKRLDAVVLGAIKSYNADRPATRGDLWGMVGVRGMCVAFGIFDAENAMSASLERLKKAGKIRYSRKPAGWVAA